MPDGAMTLSADDVEEAPALDSSQVEESTPKQYLPAVNQAIATVPKPTIPAPAPTQPIAPPSLANPKLIQAKGLIEPGQRLSEDIGNVSAAGKMLATDVPGQTFMPPGLARSGVVPHTPETPEMRAREETLARGMGSAFSLATPAMLPAAVSAPLPAAGALAAGYLASKGTRAIAKASGASPEMQDLAEQMGWLITPAGLIDPKTGIEVSPEAIRGAATILGGKAGVGAAITPEGVTIRGKVGPFEGSKTFARGPKAAPALEAPTIEGIIANAPRADIADYLQKAGGDPEKAKAMYVADQTAQVSASSLREGANAEKPAVTTPPVAAGAKTPRAEPAKPAVAPEPAAPAQTVIPPEKPSVAVKEPTLPPTIELKPSEVEVAQAKTPAEVPSPKPASRNETVAGSKEAISEPKGSTPAGKEVLPEAQAALTKGSPVTLPDGRLGTVKYVSPEDKSPVVTVTVDGKTERFVGQKEVSSLKLPPEFQAIVDKGKAEPRPGSIAPDITKWNPPKELGAFPEREDVGKKARNANPEPTRAEVKERRAIERTGQAEEDRLFGQARKELGENATTEQVVKRVEEIRGREPGKPAEAALAVPGETKPGAVGQGKEDHPTKYKFGSTQANIPEGSGAHSALEAARGRISKSDLAGQGVDVGGNHVTVRYGIKNEDVEGVRKYLASLAPFEASLGKTQKFPPTEHSDGAAVIHAPIESPELQKINAELEKHGEFTEPSFKTYAPHATVAYVRPEAAPRYVGMSVTEGKKFPVKEIAITDREGNQQIVKLEGRKPGQAPIPPKKTKPAESKPVVATKSEAPVVAEEAKTRREVISTEKKEYASATQVTGIDGAATKVLESSGERPAKYRVVESAYLIPSHNPHTFAKNAAYPSGVQERAYDTSKEAQARVIQQTQKYDPNYTINTNPDAVNGPPIITPDGIVLGGNSRAMSTARLYRAGNGNQYKGALLAQANMFGIDKERVRMMKEPVLVREIKAPKTLDDLRAIGSEYNKSMTGALGVSERAVSAGKSISRETLSNISGMLDGVGKDASLRDLMRERGKDVLSALVKDGAITERERPQFVDTATGGLSEEGKTFVERALLGSVVDDPRLMDSTPKSVLNKLDGSLAALASVAPRTDAYNILPLVRESLREHGEIAARGTNVEDYLSQGLMFGAGRAPAVDALTRVLAGKSLAARERFRRFAEDANFDAQGQGTLGLIEQPSPAKAFNDAFGTNLTDEDLENSILKAVQSEPTISGNGGEAQAVGPTEASAGNLQRSQARESRPSGEGGTGTPEKAGAETKLESLLAGESGSFSPAALNPVRIKAAYDSLAKTFINEKLKLGDKYWKVKGYDPQVADTLHLVDNAPRYFREKAQVNVKKVLAGLSDDQIRLAHLMVDSDSRDDLEANHPQEFQQAQNDPEIMKAVKAFEPLQQELTADRQALGWPVRKSLTVENDPSSANPWVVKDRQGNPVADFKTATQADNFVEKNATVEPHLKRTYPEHSKSPLPADVGAGPFTGSFYADKGLRPPKMDKKSREMSAQYHYEHGRKDFSGYLDSYAQTQEAVLKQHLFDEFTKEATDWKAGTAQPPKIKYNGKEYVRPDIALKAKQGGETLEPYAIYDPSRGEKFLIKTPDYSILSTGKPGIGPNDRYLAPKVVVDALENYDASRGGNGPSSLRRFFQEQIVGLFGPVVHVNNILRHTGHATGLGAFDPRSWPSIAKVIASPKLRERMLKGVDDATIDLLVKRGAYTDWSDIGSLNHYVGGNLNPLNWVRAFGKGVLFDPKFAGGWGGLDPKARVVIADYFKDHFPQMKEQEVADTVNDALGNYNRANWTERQKQLARFTLFPGWDTASAKWFLKHPFKVGIAGALVVMAINLALRKLGGSKGDEAYDFSYLHFGDRKYRSGLISDSMGEHFAAPLLSAGEAYLKGDDIAAGATQGVMKGTSSLIGQFSGPTVEMIADQIYNRKYAGGASEITNPQDRYTPGTWAPNRELEKRIAFAALKGLPAVNRFLAPKGDLDWKQGAGSVVGVSNYKYGAEERLRSNAARAMTVSQTLSRLAATEPEVANKFVEDPNKSVYLAFNGYFAQMEKDLKEIDTQIERVRLSDLPSGERRNALEDLKQSRVELLLAADAINDQLTDAKLRMKQKP